MIQKRKTEMSDQKRIAICGIKHAGKSTVGKIVAETLGIPFADSDELLQQKYDPALSVREIYLKLGEEGFRQLEAKTIRDFSAKKTAFVLALGGGALSNPFLTEDDLRTLGVICCIDVPDDVAYERILRKGLPPFLAKETDPRAAFARSNAARRKVFREKSDVLIKVSGEDAATVHPRHTANRLINAINLE